MQKNDLSITTTEMEKDFFNLLSPKSITLRLAKKPVFHALSRLYSSLLNEKVTPQQAVYFGYAQLSGLGMLLPYSINLGWRVCFLLIFCHTASKAWKGRKP